MATTAASLRRRPTSIGGTRWFVARELIAMGLLFTGYRQVRYLTRNHIDAATSNAHRIVDLERRLGMFTERWVQNLTLHSRAVIGFLNRYYVTVHFPLTALFVVWALVRHRNAFRHIRTWLYVVTAAALAIHVAFPLAPPRMLTEHRFVDTLQRYGPRIYSTDTTQSIANQFAAMPSLHFGWAVIVAAGFVAIRRTRRSLIAFAASRDHAGRHRRHCQPLLDGRRRRPRTDRGYGSGHPPDHELPVRPPDARARRPARRTETVAVRASDLSTASGRHQPRSAL